MHFNVTMSNILHICTRTLNNYCVCYVVVTTESLTCPICCQLYKNPKYLPCYHSYCEGCVEGMQEESKIKCPECRAESVVPTGGVKDLPANFHINSMMDRLGLKRTDEVLKCNECEDKLVLAYCQMCNSYLCQFCYEHHKRSKRFRDHNIVIVAKLNSNQHVNIQPKAVSLLCKDHDFEMLFYCKICEQLVCKHCVAKNHYGHGYSKARIQACKCQIELEATAPVKAAVDLSETHDTKDEIKKVRQF